MRIFLTVVAFALALACQAAAEQLTKVVGNVLIIDPRARPPHDVSNDSAVYMTLETAGDHADRLLAAATPAAEKAELRTYWLEGCFVHGRAVEAIELAPAGPTVLDPGGLHIMLTGLRQDLVEGDTIPLTLTFEKAGTVEIAVPVHEKKRRQGAGQGMDGQTPMN